jgi:glycosyltransferase involved in cell wall biosynthesis
VRPNGRSSASKPSRTTFVVTSAAVPRRARFASRARKRSYSASRKYSGEPDLALAGLPYFVICSTIEPRKNHLLILQEWRELVQREGAGAPKLVIVGGRGWKFEAVAALLDRSPVLRGHVIEVSGLTTPSLKQLLDGARALLMPSFAEGYGLPVVEALSAGVPVIASDIPVFRKNAGTALSLSGPLTARPGLRHSANASKGSDAQGPHRLQRSLRGSWTDYFAKIDAFVNAL